MEIKAKALSSISRFAVVLMVLCIVPSGAFASENNHTFAPVQNITEENFIDVQEDLLNSISEQIAELQGFYTNVSEASDASELQEVLSSHIPANGCRPNGMNREPCINKEPCGMPGCGMPGFDLYQVGNVTDYNFTDVQTEIVDSLGNMTEILKAEQANLTEADENDRAKELGERIADLEYLSTNISATSDATELQEVVLTYLKTQTDNSLEKEIEHLEDNVSDIENTTYDINDDIIELNDRISELTAQREKINGAESLADLKDIVFSSQVMLGMCPEMGAGKGPIHHGGCGGCDCPMLYPGKTQNNNTDNSTK